MPTLEEFCTIDVTLEFKVIGRTPNGTRVDIPFFGTATSPHWEGERPVSGIDYTVIRSDGHMDLDLHATIGEGRDTISYKGNGVSVVPERGKAFPHELLTFETGIEEFGYLNHSIAVGLGSGEEDRLSLTIYVVRRE